MKDIISSDIRLSERHWFAAKTLIAFWMPHVKVLGFNTLLVRWQCIHTDRLSYHSGRLAQRWLVQRAPD